MRADNPSAMWRLACFLCATVQASVGAWLGHCQAWPKASVGPDRAEPKIALGPGRWQTKRCHAHRQAIQAPCGA